MNTAQDVSDNNSNNNNDVSKDMPGKATRLGMHIEAWAFALGRCRFSVIVLIAGFALLMSDQGQDLLIAKGENGHIVQLTLMATIWALSIWFWSRTLLDINFKHRPVGYDDHYYYTARLWLARLLGGMAFFSVGWSAFQVHQTRLVWGMVAGFIVFIIIVLIRRSISGFLYRLAKKKKLESTASWFEIKQARTKEDRKPPPPFETIWEALAFAKREGKDKSKLVLKKTLGFPALISVSLIIIWLGLFVWATGYPVSLGTRVGAIVLFFLWGASFLPIGSLLSYWADKKRIPLLTFALLLALFSSCTNDNHEIRFTDKPNDISARRTVSEGLRLWSESNQSDDKPVPFVIVATAGGGIRAAYWTGTVLGYAHDLYPDFDQRLFAVSGVSGGSVGATIYRALLELKQVDSQQYNKICAGGQETESPKENMKGCLQAVLGKDLLGPAAARLLFPDLVQRFWPFPWFPDRGSALELGWENAFHQVVVGESENDYPHWDLLRTQGIAGLRGDPHKPALFLNSTWDNNGRRIVASNLRFATAKTGEKSDNESDSEEVIAFTRSNDELAVLGRDLRLSTAAHNSARFPGVSPPGMWKKNNKIEGRLQDGGLFENYGAETALEILDLACRKFNCVDKNTNPEEVKRLFAANKKRVVFPVVILISSDPSLWKTGTAKDTSVNNNNICEIENLAQSEHRAPIRFAYELRSTFTAYEHVRGGRGKEAADRLCHEAKTLNGEFVHFRMCEPKAEGSPPLGWALSEAARKRVESYLIKSDDADQNTDVPGCYESNHRYLVENLKQYLN